MTRRREIVTQLVKIQSEFLNNPTALLSAAQVGRRSGSDAATSQAILDVLCEAGVIARSAAATYTRYFPPRGPRFGAHPLPSPGFHDTPVNRSAA